MAKLILNRDGRYELPQGKDDYNKTITCGSCIELQLGDICIKGNVEHDGIGYYFYAQGSGKIYLNESLTAR